MMAEQERDEEVSASYHALGSEEPSAALDAAILAAARRRRLHWKGPVSIAAVLVLAVGVTLRMQRERPDAEPVVLAPQVMETPPPASPARELARPVQRAADAASERAAAPAAQARSRGESAAKPAEDALAPEAWLERIVELRKAGRAWEADESFAAFKRKFPDYRIPDAMLGRVAPAQ